MWSFVRPVQESREIWRWVQIASVAAGVILLLVVAYRILNPREPDWAGMVEDRFGRLVDEINVEAFQAPFEGEGGSITRAAWVRWSNGETAFLGLPSYGVRDPAQIITRADLLPREDWWDWCSRTIPAGPNGYGILLDRRVTDTIIVFPQLQELNQSAPNPSDPRCEFRFRAGRWELRTVQVERRPVDLNN